MKGGKVQLLECEYCGAPYVEGAEPECCVGTCRDKIRNLEGKISRQAQELTQLNESLRQKNIDLDAMHFVWCDGGCFDGVHRHTEGEVTEEIVKCAEINVKRLREWFENRAYRDQYEKP
jgi:hypothetical protein